MLESYSAGTEPKGAINPDTQRLMMERHDIDMVGSGQRSKLVAGILDPRCRRVHGMRGAVPQRLERVFGGLGDSMILRGVRRGVRRYYG